MSLNQTLDESAYTFINPATQTPLFVAEWITCAYPISDLYASSPRYLYYALLVLVFLTQWHSWLANVFLGVVATYAGVAAIEAIILISWPSPHLQPGNVTIPYLDPLMAMTNDTFTQIPNLVTGKTSVNVNPMAVDFDMDAVIAITVTGYLLMLPIHCWSTAVRRNRARHVLILLWNMIMCAGMICSIVIWPTLFEKQLQFRFCYPSSIDDTSMTSDGRYTDDVSRFRHSWNETIWTIFSNFSLAANLNDNCFYPCYNTTQVLRRENTLMATVESNKSVRMKIQLEDAGLANYPTRLWSGIRLASLMYVALILTSLVMLVMLLFILTPLHRVSRVPLSRPKELFSQTGRNIMNTLGHELRHGLSTIADSCTSPCVTYRKIRAASRAKTLGRLWVITRFNIDVLALILLFVAMFLTPITMIVFVVFIEWYIHRDLVSSEAPQQVGQWSTSVSVALILISAIVLRLRYHMASRDEIHAEITETRTHLEELQNMLMEKEQKNSSSSSSSSSSENGIREWELRMATEWAQRVDENRTRKGAISKSRAMRSSV